MSIPSNALPLAERINTHQAQLARVTEALAPSGIHSDRVDVQSSELAVTLRNQMQNIGVENQANAVLARQIIFWSWTCEPATGALSASDVEVIRAERNSLTSEASNLLRDSQFGGQSTLDLAGSLAPIDPGALRDSFAATVTGNAEALDTARESLAETRTAPAAEGSALAVAASRSGTQSMGVEATRPDEDLAALLSGLQQSAAHQQIAGRIHQIDKLSGPDVLNLLLQ